MWSSLAKYSKIIKSEPENKSHQRTIMYKVYIACKDCLKHKKKVELIFAVQNDSKMTIQNTIW